ncbi:NAD(P)H-dependent oxidoreductase [Microbacterium sp. BWT-B31]|uniref:NADPH-dependent FMN reductase n=1 Tax=Microbacterium sp. BWT-B31 TaxID=3232072 RepID=UPI00352941E3
MSGIVVLVGNPKAQSRTLKVAIALAERIARRRDLHVRHIIDLAGISHHVFDWPSEPMSRLTRIVSEAELVVVATPTYKASYTGLLKAFLDRYSRNGLDGVVAVPVMTTSSAEHALAVDYTLTPLLAELGATVPTRGVTFHTRDMPDLYAILDEWVERNDARLATAGARRLQSA